MSWRPIPDYGDHMTWKEFYDCCKSRFFIDYDGFARPASETHMGDKTIYPSTVLNGWVIDKPTHVVWFNK
jgi:hypothetical protein